MNLAWIFPAFVLLFGVGAIGAAWLAKRHARRDHLWDIMTIAGEG